MVPKIVGLVLFIGIAISIVLFSQTVGFSIARYIFRPYGPIMPLITHIVLFQFKDGTPPSTVQEIASHFFSLKETCIHPSTQKPYIVSIAGGKDISIESLQSGISHAFVLHFDSKEARDYYVNDDLAHQAFKKAAREVLKQAIIVDFQDGLFAEA